MLAEVGRTIGQLHAIPLDLPFREDFAVRARSEWQPYFGSMPYERELVEQLDRVEELRISALAVADEFVVTHTDLIGSNLLVDDAGRISVLDWDDVRLAPPEYDLSLLLHGVQPMDGRALSAVLEVYPARPLRVELFAFFLLRRCLDDFFARLELLATGDPAPTAALEAREGLEVWGADQWRHLDRLLEFTRSALLCRDRFCG